MGVIIGISVLGILLVAAVIFAYFILSKDKARANKKNVTAKRTIDTNEEHFETYNFLDEPVLTSNKSETIKEEDQAPVIAVEVDSAEDLIKSINLEEIDRIVNEVMCSLKDQIDTEAARIKKEIDENEYVVVRNKLKVLSRNAAVVNGMTKLYLSVKDEFTGRREEVEVPEDIYWSYGKAGYYESDLFTHTAVQKKKAK